MTKDDKRQMRDLARAVADAAVEFEKAKQNLAGAVSEYWRFRQNHPRWNDFADEVPRVADKFLRLFGRRK